MWAIWAIALLGVFLFIGGSQYRKENALQEEDRRKKRTRQVVN